MRRDMNTRLIFTAAGLSAGALLTLGLSVGAEDTELDSDPRVIPYNGVLEFDGQAYNGPADIRFTLTGEDPESCTFVEEHEDVPVYTGRFSVNIGVVNGDAGMNCLFDATAVYLQMAVRGGASEQEHAPLAGRQRINPVPFAYWAAEGSDLKVDGHLSAASASVNGPLTASSASVNGPLTASSASVNDGLRIGQDNVRSPSGTSRLRLASNFDGNGINNNNDYQLTLFESNNPTESYGLLAQPRTMAFNVSNDAGYAFYRGGSNTMLRLANDGSTLNTDLDLSGDLAVTGALNAPTIRGVSSINASGGAFSTGGDLNVGGNVNASTLTGVTSINAGGAAFSIGGGFNVLENIYAPNNRHDECQWEGSTRGTSADGETLEGFCSQGRYVAGIRRYHGGFDFGIEELTLWCCKL